MSGNAAQNNGNMLSERSSTRIHHPPGGGSSWSIGGGVQAQPKQRSANSYANGGNQNCGNVMTGRSTTRLHAPPGGKSSFSIGHKGGPSDVTGKIGSMGNRPAPRKQQQISAKPGQQQIPQQQQQQAACLPKAHGTSANRYANGANQNCGNVITDRPTSRVLKPPGGGSSGPLW